ncbi:MAG: cyclophilin-like fold protein [Phycisphaerae bacterium]|nr:cyclophilin-like fold protein [Phycisphaerae bacterium]
MEIQIKSNDITMRAELDETPTGAAIAAALPIDGTVNRWGGEVYFSIPVSVGLEADSRDILEPGELGYWPTGNAFYIFFGATPASQGDECRAASNVNVFGRILSNLEPLWNIKNGAQIRIQAV